MPTKYDPRRKRDTPEPLTTADLTALTPEQDFSPTAAAKRELVKSLDYDDTRRLLNQQYTRVSQRADAPEGRAAWSSPRKLALAALTKQIGEIRDNEAARQAGFDLANYPSIQDIVRVAEDQGAQITVDDVKNLIDFSMVNDAADTIIAGIDPNVGDPNVVVNVATTLADTNPVAAALLIDVVKEKLSSAATDPTLIDQVAATLAGAIGWLSTPFVAAWEWSAQGVAAGNYAAANSGRSEFTWPNQIAGYFNPSDREAVEKGKFNQDYLKQLAEQTNPDGTPMYSPLQMEIVTEVVRRQALGDPQPLGLWQEKYAGDLAAAQVFGDLAYNRATGNTQELYRQVRSASLSDLGSSMLGSALDSEYSAFRGTELRSNIADVTGFVTGFAADPTNLAFGAGRAVQAARWSLTKLAPGMGEADKVLRSMRLGGGTVGFEFNPAYRFFDNFTSDLNKYDDLIAKANEASAAGDTKSATRLRGNAADLRGKMARQYDDMPEGLIDDFHTHMPRNSDGVFDVSSAAAWIQETNDAATVTAGRVMPQLAQMAAEDTAKRAVLLEIISAADDAAAVKKAKAALSSLDSETSASAKPLHDELRQATERTLYAQVGRTTQTGTPLIPRMSALARARKDAVNAVKVTQATPSAVDRLISKHLPNVTDADTFADDLSRNAELLGFDVRNFRAGQGGNVLSAAPDALGRMASSLPDVGRLAIHDASSTKPFYRLARAFFPKRIARLMADQWRAATPGARRKMLNGLVRSAAAVRGIRLTDDQLVAFMDGLPTVNNLATGTRIGERYAVTITDGVLPTERAALASGSRTPASTGEAVSLSADANGIEHALHLEDTADYVRIPSMRQFEQLRSEQSLAMQGYYYAGRGGEHVTNAMSFLTLYGLRFSLRNAIEEDGLFLFMGGGASSLAKGRQMDQAVRRATPRFVVKDVEGQPTVVMKSSLGMVANKAEGLSNFLASKGSPQWLNELVYSSINREAAQAAIAAKKAGDPDAFANLVVEAEFARRIGRRGFSLLSADDRKILRYFAESSHGQVLYDEVAQGAAYLQNAALPNFVTDTDMLTGAVPGVTVAKLRNPSKLSLEGYDNIPPIQVDAATGNRIMGVTAWWEQLRKTLQTDGPIGEVAVRMLRDPAKAKAEIARIIREDTEFGYKAKLSRITDDIAVDEYANAYFENVFQHFTKSDGTVNVELQGRFISWNDDLGRMEASWWKPLDDSDDLVARVGMASLEDIPVNDRPLYIFGPKWSEDINVPIPEAEAALLTPTRGYNWMARQNARISRGPIFMANLVNAWGESVPVRNALAKAIAKGADRAAPNANDLEMAERLTSTYAMDQAYSKTLAYVDNPANRSNLAWKARNVSRYYRATEDFWRRMKRVAKNRPETFWRVALTYQLATDTAFVYQDDQGTSYVGYPGNEQLNQGLSAVWMFLGGTPMSYSAVDPFFMGAKLSGATPSTDLNQQLPSAFGGTAVALTTIFSAFPALYKLKGVQKLALGQYAQVTGNPLSDFVSAMTPPLVDRAQAFTDPEQFDASIGQAANDTLAIMYAEGMLDTVTIDGTQIPLNEMVTPDQFKHSEEYVAAQRIGIANWITRSWFQFSGAAAPQQYANNVSKIGRDLGMVGLKPEFYELYNAAADMPNPWAFAQAQFMAMQVKKMKDGEQTSIASFLPFTLSTHKSPTDTPSAALAALSDMRLGTQEWLTWWESDNTRNLVRNGYQPSAYYLAPRKGEFDWVSWQVAKNDLGLKVKMSEDDMIQDLLSLNGSYTESQIRNSYREMIEAEDAGTEQGRARIKELQDQQSMDLESNKMLNPSWDLVSGQRNSEFTDSNYRAALGNMRGMLNYLRERDGKLTGSAEQINNAINIYLHYQQQINGLQGSSSQRSLAKKQKQAEMDVELAVVAGLDENAAVFIGNVIDNLSYKPQFPAFGDQ